MAKKKETSFKKAEETKKDGRLSFLYPISRDSSYIKAKKWIGSSESPLITFDKDFTFENFLSYKGEDSDLTNWDRLQASYVGSEELKTPRTAPIFKRGVKVALPTVMQSKIDKDFDSINKTPTYSAPETVIGDQEKDLANDPYYDKRLINYKHGATEFSDAEEFFQSEHVFAYENAEGKATFGKPIALTEFTKIGKAPLSVAPPPFFIGTSCGVWIYSKSQGKLFNFSKKVTSMRISSQLKGSSFEISLGGVDFGLEVDYDWKVDGASSVYKDQNLLVSSILSDGNSSLYDFTRILSVNDIVFLKFSEIDKAYLDEVEVPLSELSGNFYDLIGLIDNVSEGTEWEENDVSITISGRDFSKALEDDEAKFFPIALTETLNNRMVLSTGGLQKNSLLKRTFFGEYYTLFSFIGGSVGEIFMWYLNLLANLGIVPEEEGKALFSSYSDKRQMSDMGESKPRPGIFQIIKLVVDERIKDRKLVDKNIGSPDGNFIHLFDNLCVSPFVEWYMDTYGDMFNIVVRQPPFTQALISAYLKSTLSYKAIPNRALYSTNFEFETEVYTWYQLYPTGAFWGVTNKMALDFLPVVQLDEYVERWGSRPLSLETNYIDMDTTVQKGGKQDLTTSHKRAIDDLLIMVEAYSHLPFTRRGQITLSYLDRGFRKGTFCYLEKTSEIFYIESVSHSASMSEGSLEGYTTLNVVRGMVLDFIKGVFINGKNHSYFNIVNKPLIKSVLYRNYQIDGKGTSSEGSTFVDPDIFKFFIQRKQFDK